jgi:hypothetical protein
MFFFYFDLPHLVKRQFTLGYKKWTVNVSLFLIKYTWRHEDVWGLKL